MDQSMNELQKEILFHIIRPHGVRVKNEHVLISLGTSCQKKKKKLKTEGHVPGIIRDHL